MTSRSATSISENQDLPPTVVASSPRCFSASEPLVAELADQMNRAWRQGQRVTAHELLTPHPELCQERDLVLRLVCEELGLRREHGLTISPGEWQRLFPQWQDELDALLARQELLDTTIQTAPARLPRTLQGYKILCELGEGGQGQVYVASQPRLADRPVVIKVTPCRGREHLNLARLQHTHIVPLLAAHDFPEENQRILCMPYYGGMTLARLFGKIQHIPLAERQGTHVLEIIDQAPSPIPVPVGSRRPARRLLARANYAQAIAWLAACLADALQYAHERELLHLDIKPSNVLWAADGQPMLLDFHLARPPIRAEVASLHGVGGTPLWMAPELEAAVKAVFGHRPAPCDVDARADVFALGLLLYQALGGILPYHLQRPTRLETTNPQVSPGLADVIHRCLAAEPCHRYPDAQSLGADLRRHLSDLPLHGVANRSWRERWQKWRRRRPHALTIGMLVMLVVATGSLAIGWRQWTQSQVEKREQEARLAADARRQRAETALGEAKQHLQEQKYQLALITLEQAKALLPNASDASTLHREFADQEQVARRQYARQLLHDGVNVLRAAVVADSLTPGQLIPLVRKCDELLQQRAVIAPDRANTDERTSRDLTDLTVIGTELILRATPPDQLTPARRESLAILDEIERRCGNSPLLDDLKQQLQQALGAAVDRPALVLMDQLPKLAAWEHVARARQLLQSWNRPAATTAAVAQLGLPTSPWDLPVGTAAMTDTFPLILAAWHTERAIAADPGQYWAHFYQGVAAYRLHRYTEASQAFRICIALQPRQAAGYHNRALTAAAKGEMQLALADYTRALELEPKFAPSALNRALVHVQLRDYDAAIRDLQLARLHGADPEVVRTNLAAIERLRHAASD